MLRYFVILSLLCHFVSCDRVTAEDLVPVPPDSLIIIDPAEPDSKSVAEQVDEESAASILRSQFGVELRYEDSMVIDSIADHPASYKDEQFFGGTIFKIRTRTYNYETHKTKSGDWHHVHSTKKLLALLKTKNFRECTTLDVQCKFEGGRQVTLSPMRLSEIDKKRKSSLQPEVPLGFTKGIRIK